MDSFTDVLLARISSEQQILESSIQELERQIGRMKASRRERFAGIVDEIRNRHAKAQIRVAGLREASEDIAAEAKALYEEVESIGAGLREAYRRTHYTDS